MRCAQNNIQGILQTSLKSVRPKDRNACRRRMDHARRCKNIERPKPTLVVRESGRPTSSPLVSSPPQPPSEGKAELANHSSVSEDALRQTTVFNLPSLEAAEYDGVSGFNDWEFATSHADTTDINTGTQTSDLYTDVTYEDGTCIPISVIDRRYGIAERHLGLSQPDQLPDSTPVSPSSFQGHQSYSSKDLFSQTIAVDDSFDIFATSIASNQDHELLDMHHSVGPDVVKNYDDQGLANSIRAPVFFPYSDLPFDPNSLDSHQIRPLPTSPISPTEFRPISSLSDIQTSTVKPPLARKHRRIEIESSRPSIKDPTLQRQQKTGSISKLRNLAKRLSYTSSQLDDVFTAFGCLSLSSESSRFSRASTTTLDVAGEFPKTQPTEIDQNDAYFEKQSLRLPGQALKDDNTHLAMIKCHRQLNLHGYAHPFSELLDRKDHFNNTTLHLTAAASPHYYSLIIFLDQGYLLNVVNTGHQTFMHVLNPSHLIRDGTLPMFLTELTKTQFDFGLRDIQGSSILHVLLTHKLLTMISQLKILAEVFAILAGHLSAMSHRDNMGRTPQSQLLHIKRKRADSPASFSDMKQIDMILDKYYGIEYPLLYHAAIYDRHIRLRLDSEDDILESLILRAIEEPGSEDQYGRNGLHCLACRCGTRTEDASATTSAVKSSAFSVRREMRDSPANYLKKLLARGVDLNAFDRTGQTPLLAMINNASSINRAENRWMEKMITRLLHAGANVNLRGRGGVSPLHDAVRRGLVSITSQLLVAGANTQATDCAHYSIITTPYDLGTHYPPVFDRYGIIETMDVNPLKAIEIYEAHRRQKKSAKAWKSVDTRIVTCKNLVIDRGGVECPTFDQEWSIG